MKKQDIGRRIHAAAMESGLTLRELAARIGVSHPTIYAYTSGALQPPASRLRQIAEALGKQPDYFQTKPDAPTASSIDKVVDALLNPPDSKKAYQVAIDAANKHKEDGKQVQQAMALHKAGNALLYDGAYKEASTCLAESLEIFRSLELPERAGAVAQSLGYCLINLGQLDAAESCFSTAEENYGESEKWKAKVSMAALEHRRGNFKESDSLLQALESGKPTSEAAAYILFNKASHALDRGFWARSLELNRKALNVAKRHRLTDQICERMNQIAHGLAKSGELETASLWVIRAQDTSEAANDQARLALASAICARIRVYSGRIEEGLGLAQKAIDLGKAGGYPRSQLVGMEVLAEATLCSESPDLSVIERALEFAKQNCYPASIATLCAIRANAACRVEPSASLEFAQEAVQLPFLTELGEQRAMALSSMAKALANHPSEAARWSREALAVAIESGSHWFAIQEKCRLAEYLRLSGETNEAVKLSEELDNERVRICKQTVHETLDADLMTFQVELPMC
jgi:transcriptional regulator with XRE-family HTH domain